MSKRKRTGLGDVIAEITTAIGIEPCEGCNKRKEVLNRIFPFKSPYEMTESDKKFMAEFLNWYNGLPIPVDKVNDILEAEKMWMRLFKVTTEPCRNCGVAYQNGFINDLKTLYENS